MRRAGGRRRRWLALGVVAATALVVAPAAGAERIYAVSSTNVLFSFDSASPGTLTSLGTITGLQPGEAIYGMDFRPRDGRLYAVGTTNRVYVIDPTARAATAVGPPFTPGVTENASGVDFDPVADQLRLLPGGNARENLVVDPGSGQVVRVATPVNQLSFFTGIAYDNAFFGATAATLYVHDCAIDHLGRVGSVGGSPQSADSGQFTDIGPLGFGTSLCDNVDLDISPGGTAYGLFDPGNVQGLYQVSLTTGSANLIGTLGAGGPFTDIAVAPVQTQIAFPSPTVTAFESDGTVDLAVQRTSSPSVGAATVHYATASGSATAGSDFQPVSGTLTFAPGQTLGTISVPIVNDTTHENTKSFTVELSSPLGGAATVGSPATVRIVDDDAAPVVTDRTPPFITLSGFPSKTTFAKLVKGVRVTVSAGEAATFDATLEARALRAQIAAAAPFNLTLAHANVGRLSTKATLRLRPKRRLLGSPRRLTVRVRLTATDAAGNHTEKTRTIAVRRR